MLTRPSKATNAFTLIELLVVTAVLSILAALAISTLSGAKIRAEIAQAKTGLKTISASIAMYQTDHNSIPPAPQHILGPVPRYAKNLFELTTPIPYLKTIPQSPWAKKNMHLFNMFDGYRRERIQSRTGRKVKEDWEQRPDYRYTEGGFLTKNKSQWTLLSYGPTRQYTLELYAPSNGIISIGGIFVAETNEITKKMEF